MSAQEREQEMLRYMEYRQRYIVLQLPAARAKVKALENEARRYGMKELLTDTAHSNRAWDEAIDDARAFAGTVDIAGMVDSK